jgi:predicted NBD/HSP70 family sugar kinase
MKTADPELMRAINRFHVMDAIRRDGPISRVEICGRTQLSPTTVSAITAALLEDGLIVPRHVNDTRDAARGRPRVMLELNPDAAFVVGAKLTPDQITVTTTDFRADPLASIVVPVRLGRQPVSVIADLVEDGVRRCVAEAGRVVDRAAGLCVGLPGRVEHDSGICRASPIFGAPDVRLAAELQARLGVPTTIESDVTLVTMAEHWFGRARGLDDFLVVSVEHELGLGIMHRGEIFRGRLGLGPDLGGVVVNMAGAPVPLGAVASEAAILARAQTVLADTPYAPWFRTGRGMAAVVAAAQAGDARILAILDEAGEALGFAVANLIALFAPATIVLAGEATAAGPALLDRLHLTLARVQPPGSEGATEIMVHQWSDDSWARGAAALTLRELYGAPWNTTGPAGLR